MAVGGFSGIPGQGGLNAEGPGGPLAGLAIQSQALDGMGLVNFLLMTFLRRFLLEGLLLIGLTSLVPGLGIVVAVAHSLAGGMMLAPSTLTLLERLPLRGAVVAIESQAYAILAFGGLHILLGVVRPKDLGAEKRTAGYMQGISHFYRLIPLAALVLGAAVVLETAMVAILAGLK